MPILDFHFSPRASRQLSNASFGLLAATGLDRARLGEALKPIRKSVQRTLAVPANAVETNLAAFDRYFAENHHRSPLRHQREHFLKAGIPSSNPILTLLLLAELQHGMLVGIQDATTIVPPLEFDVLAHGDRFEGMRGKVHCNPGEVVLRDSNGIIASLFQGPDKRTEIHDSSRDIVAFVFAVPGEERGQVSDTLKFLQSMLAPAVQSAQFETHSPGPTAYGDLDQ
jgi:hypothetical protein